ncbi:MAG: hypothetical protein ABGY41_20790, partial [Candidatus Poribacteria bacterium]
MGGLYTPPFAGLGHRYGLAAGPGVVRDRLFAHPTLVHRAVGALVTSVGAESEAVGRVRQGAVHREHAEDEQIPQPEASIGTFMICAETEKEARRLGSSRDFSLLRRARGQQGPFPSVAEAEAHDYSGS